jgi:hypothetical protein
MTMYWFNIALMIARTTMTTKTAAIAREATLDPVVFVCGRLRRGAIRGLRVRTLWQ